MNTPRDLSLGCCALAGLGLFQDFIGLVVVELLRDKAIAAVTRSRWDCLT